MDERLRELFGDEEAWVVGGAVRDELLLRPVLDVDVACAEPRDAANRFARRFGGSVFPLSERHGAWRVVADGAVETVDFTPIGEGIDADLATRDFTFNAIAVHVRTGSTHDPYDGRSDLEARVVRLVAESVFVDDPLRLLRAVRFEDELGLRMDDRAEALLRASAALVTQPAGERVLAELDRLSADGYRRLDEVGLLAPLGGSLDDRLDALDDPDFRLVVVFGSSLRLLPISNELKRYAGALARARRPEDPSPREIHRFRRATEPWALDALAYVGAPELVGVVEAARRADPAAPLVRGDELGLEPGPAIGRILDAIDEERAAGTISTRDEALALARELAAQESAAP
jgi:Poly A polymerase head domain